MPAELTTVEFFADVARVLRPDGVLLANVADGPPAARYSRRLAAAIRAALARRCWSSPTPRVLKGRRFGNVVLRREPASLPVARAPAGRSAGAVPAQRAAGAATAFAGGARR